MEQLPHLVVICPTTSETIILQWTVFIMTSDCLCAHQVEQVSFYPVFPAAVGLLPLLDTHQLISVPGNQRLASAHEQTLFYKRFRPLGPKGLCFHIP